MSMEDDASDVIWESIGPLSLDTPTYTIAYDVSPPTFRERLKMSWQFLWTGKMDYPDRLIAFWKNEIMNPIGEDELLTYFENKLDEEEESNDRTEV